MKKNICSQTLIDISIKKYIYMTIFFALLFFLLVQLLAVLNTPFRSNVYDLFMKATDFYSLFYIVVPLFLILILSFFSTNKSIQYFLLRFENRKQLFLSTTLALLKLSIGFTLVILFIIVFESLFSLSFQNIWSDFMLSQENYYYFVLHPGESYYEFFNHSTPLAYTINSLILIFLMLFSFALICYLLFMWTSNIFISFILAISINFLNIVTEIMFIDKFSLFSMVKHVIPLEYMALYQLDGTYFPYQMFIFWGILIIILFCLGYISVDTCDFDTAYKGEN